MKTETVLFFNIYCLFFKTRFLKFETNQHESLNFKKIHSTIFHFSLHDSHNCEPPTRHASKDIVLTHAILFSVNANQMYEQIPEIFKTTMQLMTEICARGVIEHACREIKRFYLRSRCALSKLGWQYAYGPTQCTC